MCVDFINLNETCPKNSFPISCINQIVDSTFEHEQRSFMDAFLGYNKMLWYSPN